MRQYFLTIPKEIEEAARIDGASFFTTFWRVMLPLAGPAVAAVAILQFQGTWNGYFWPYIIIQDPDQYTVPVALSFFRLAGGLGTNWPPLMAMVVMATFPSSSSTSSSSATSSRGSRPVASRAEAPSGPAQGTRLPRLGTIVRAALSDYYFNSMRLVAANLVWGVALALILVVGLTAPLLSLALLPLLAFPTAGVFRLAARIVRVEPGAGLRDIAWPYRHMPGRWLVSGIAVVAVGADARHEHRGRADRR